MKVEVSMRDMQILTNAVADAEHFAESVRRMEQAIADLTAPLWLDEARQQYGSGREAFVEVGDGRDSYRTDVPREPIVEILRGQLVELIEKRDAALAVVQRAAAATRGET